MQHFRQGHTFNGVPLAIEAIVGDHSTMKTLTSNFSRLCAVALITASAACSGVAGNEAAPAKSAPTPARTPLAAAAPAAAGLMQQIKAEIGDAVCDNSQQCRTLPVGHRACGGPDGYLPYSTKRSDAAKLARLAAQDSAARKEQDTRSGMISTCQVMLDPGATCSAGRCVAASGDRGPLPTQ